MAVSLGDSCICKKTSTRQNAADKKGKIRYNEDSSSCNIVFVCYRFDFCYPLVFKLPSARISALKALPK